MSSAAVVIGTLRVNAMTCISSIRLKGNLCVCLMADKQKVNICLKFEG